MYKWYIFIITRYTIASCHVLIIYTYSMKIIKKGISRNKNEIGIKFYTLINEISIQIVN